MSVCLCHITPPKLLVAPHSECYQTNHLVREVCTKAKFFTPPRKGWRISPKPCYDCCKAVFYAVFHFYLSKAGKCIAPQKRHKNITVSFDVLKNQLKQYNLHFEDF